MWAATHPDPLPSQRDGESHGHCSADKIGLVMGVANDHSIAWAMSQALYAEGAELAFTHLPSPSSERRVRELGRAARGPSVVCALRRAARRGHRPGVRGGPRRYGRLDFLIHVVAFAPPQELRKPYMQMSRAGWHLAMDISVYSLVAACRAAAPLMTGGGADRHDQLLRRRKGHPRLQRHGRVQGGLGTQRPLPGLGPGPAEHPRQRHQRRAACGRSAPSGIAGFDDAARARRARRPRWAATSTRRNSAPPASICSSDLSGGVTGETIHVDCGYSIVGL